PEGALVDGNYAGGIANVTATTDISVNEQAAIYTPAQWAATNGKQAKLTADNYVPTVPGCTYGNDTSVANGGLFQHFDGTPYSGACITNAAAAGAQGADGKPDGFAKPIRRYQELVVEYNRNLKNRWQAR